MSWIKRGQDIDGLAAGDGDSIGVAISANGLVVATASRGNDAGGTDSGMARVFVWNAGTSLWVQRGVGICGEAAGDQVSSVALSSDGTILAVGAFLNNGTGGTDCGNVRVYSWNGSAWIKRGQDIDGKAANDQSALSIALSLDGNTLAIGSRFNDAGGSNAGQVRVFTWNGSSWIQRGSDINGKTANETYGMTVAMSDDGTVVGSGAYNANNGAGLVRIYQWNGTAWNQMGTDIIGTNLSAGNEFGYSISLSSTGSVFATGASGHNSLRGYVAIYAWNGSSWVQRGSNIAGAQTGEQFGQWVYLSGDGSIVAATAPTNNANGTDSGCIRIYAWNGSSWIQRGATINSEASGDALSRIAISADGLTLIAGAYANDGTSGVSSDNRGSSRVFVYTTVPDAPTIGAVTAGNTQATVSFTAPSNNGGSAITGYTVTSSPEGKTATGISSPLTVTGLTNGTSYTFTVVATNSIGSSVASGASNSVTPKTAPSVPVIGTATAGNGQATVSFTTSTSDGGGGAITYTATSSPGGLTASGSGSPLGVTGLTNGTAYTFTVTATNSGGTSADSAASNSVTPRTVPNAPTNITTTAGNGQVVLNFTAPDNGGAAITSYTVTTINTLTNGATTTDTSNETLPITISGLTNGTPYTFRVKATNIIGSSANSDATSAVTPATVPSAPSNAVATPQGGQATVSFQLSTNNGGSAIINYKVTSSGGQMATGATSPIIVTGLTNGTAYTFSVVATNAAGESDPSAPSAAVTPTPIPGAPSNGAAIASNGQLTLAWQAPSVNASSVVGYKVYNEQDVLLQSVADAQAVVTPLTNGTRYGFKIAAYNSQNVEGDKSALFYGVPLDTSTTQAVQAAAQNIAEQAATSTEAAGQTTAAAMASVTTTEQKETLMETTYQQVVANQGQAAANQVAAATITNAPTQADADLALRASVRSALEGQGAAAAAQISATIVDTRADAAKKTDATEKTISAVIDTTLDITKDDGLSVQNQTIANNTAAVLQALPSAVFSVAATQAVNSVVSATTKSLAEQATLIAATATALSADPAQKATYLEAAASNSTLTAAPIPLTATQSSVLLEALPAEQKATDIPAGVELKQIFPSITGLAANDPIPVNLLQTDYVYVGMIPGREYKYIGSVPNPTANPPANYSTIVVFNGTTKKLVSNGISYSPGEAIPIGTSNVFKIAAVGTGVGVQVTAPGAPTGVSAVAGDAQATVSFTPPASNGGANITGYTVTSSPGGKTKTGLSSPLTVTDLTNGTSYTFTVVATNSVGSSDNSAASNSVVPMGPAPGNIPCFPAGVMIRTPEGEKAVETLKTGDLVVTAAGRVVPVRMHSYSLEATTAATAPYFIPAHALGPKAPAKPLHLSPLHAFQVRPNVWWCAQQAAKVSSKIQQYAVGESIIYYHVECPNFLRDNLVANGVVVESFAGKQLTAAESRNIYKFDKKVGGYVRSAPARAITGSSST
jgi:trimeric autotransporter adhesin